MKVYQLSDLLPFDTETTGLVPKGSKWESDFNQFPYIVSLSWIAGGYERDFIIKPDGWVIPIESSEIHGITMDVANENGVPMKDALIAFVTDCQKYPLLVAHNIYFDISIIKANIIRELGIEWYYLNADDALHKSKRIDTMKSSIKFVGATFANSKRLKFPSLEELYDKCFPGQSFPAHNSLEDVKAVVRCLPVLLENEIIQLKKKEYEPEQLKMPEETVKKRTREIIVDDSGEIPEIKPEQPEPINPSSDIDDLLNLGGF